MKYSDIKDLPVEIKDNELPEDNDKNYKMFYNESPGSSGFVDAIFLGGIMLVCFLWGMLVVILRG